VTPGSLLLKFVHSGLCTRIRPGPRRGGPRTCGRRWPEWSAA
jgi:hypothetical protein